MSAVHIVARPLVVSLEVFALLSLSTLVSSFE